MNWITAKFASKCACGTQIKKGAVILYDRKKRTASCQKCGEQYDRYLAAADFDEAQYNSGYGSY